MCSRDDVQLRQGSIEAVLGMAPADGLWVDQEGLHAKGWIDVTTPAGAKVHEMLRRDVLNWSIGFTIKTSRLDRDGKTRVLSEVGELLELSAVAVPANPRTRTAQLKHAKPKPPTIEELRERALALGLEHPTTTSVPGEISRHFYDLMRMPVDSKRADSEPTNRVPTADELLARAKALGVDPRPIQVKRFEVE